jgi:hypothetical protein
MLHFIYFILFTFIAFSVGTLIFDFCHYGMHLCLKSKNKILRKIGQLHLAHHKFLPSSLVIDENARQKNMFYHVIFEYLINLIGIFSCLLFLPKGPVIIAFLVQTGFFFFTFYMKGNDLHHRTLDRVSPDRGVFFVYKDYHAMHHIYPNYFFSSYLRLLDIILGTAIVLNNKEVVMTGVNGALGSQMKLLLEKEGAKVTPFKYGIDYTYQHYESLVPALRNADILVLCHGTKYDSTQQANCDSYVEIIQLFKKVYKKRLVPVEVWAVGSEIECHPCFGIESLKNYAQSKRNYSNYAKRFFYDPEIQYRHLVHSAFTSRMGRGLMSASFAAFITLFLIKRDFKYVPVTYTGIAFINYFRYFFHKKRPS